jgi:hypothetical protein
MRLFRSFFIGLLFAGFVLLATSPVLVAGVALTAWVLRGEVFNALDGASVFGLREKDGRLDGRMINVNFQTTHVQMPGEIRPRRLVLRLEVTNADVFDGRPGEGRVRLDAWPVESAEDVRKPALYTIVAPGRAASMRWPPALGSMTPTTRRPPSPRPTKAGGSSPCRPPRKTCPPGPWR